MHNECGQSSSKHDTNDDERPLKKARYVWEVKGKYHLKETLKNNITNEDSGPTTLTVPCVDYNSYTNENNINNNVVCNNNNIRGSCNNTCCIESLLAKTEALMDSDDEEVATKNIDKSISNEIPVTLVSPNPKNQDYYLRKWQARQVARGFVDNTINRVLETWMVAPFDAADFVENCENDGLVEDEGILMAIQSHGLQSNFALNNFESGVNSDINKSRDTLPVSSALPDLTQSTRDNFQNVHNELVKEGISSSSNDSMSCDSNEDNTNLNDTMDFLNAAVSVAILKKGLSSYPCG